MTERQEEQLALHALRTLSAEELRLLESEWRYDPRMRDTLDEFEDSAAEIARLLPEESPPDELRAQLLVKLKAHSRKAVPFSAPLRLLRSPVVAWAAAATVVVASLGLWTRNRQLDQRMHALAQSEITAKGEAAQARDAQLDLEKQLAAANAQAAGLTAELDRVRQGFAVSAMQVAMLRSSLKRYEEGVALVVWNQEKQEGLLKIEHMPPAQAGKDYQLWVICKQQRAPVNAGILKVDDQGVATVTFKPGKRIAEVAKFAISVESAGGVAEKSEDGPIILAGR